MNDAHMIQLVAGSLCATVTGVSAAFVIYWNLIAKKHVVALTNDSKVAMFTAKPALHLATAHRQQN
jgi:hypothetical protein